MTREEVAKLFMVINFSYPSFGIDESDAATKIAVWHEFLKDFPFEEAQANLWRHTVTNKFPPTVAEIRNPYGEPEQRVSHEAVRQETQQYLLEVDRRREEIAPPPLLPAFLQEGGAS